jgi:hypothetical protein
VITAPIIPRQMPRYYNGVGKSLSITIFKNNGIKDLRLSIDWMGPALPLCKAIAKLVVPIRLNKLVAATVKMSRLVY